MTFGERIVTARKNIGLSQKELAEKLGISATRLNYWEKNKRFPPIPMLNSLCEILKLEGDELIGRNKKKSPETEDTDSGDTEKWLTNLLIDRGYIKQGEDISELDKDFLIHWIWMLDAWFQKN
jgi:transcriptional regulator with XRE-family HTH domain|nr:helix-turn-helix transcriptional regulator [uncultured Schaedlerella sp.]